MNKRKLTIILTIVDVVSVIALIACFLYRFTLVISDEPNVYWGSSGKFTTYSFFDGVIKINLIFVILILIVLIVMKVQKTEKVGKTIGSTLVVLLILFVSTNVIHLIGYDVKYYTKWDWYGTNEEDFEPIPTQYKKYFPYFDKLDNTTDSNVIYEYTDSTTPLGSCFYMQTSCEDLNLTFYYEEIYTKSSLLMTQFITTKGKPNWDNEKEETVYMESVQNEKYKCSVYNHEDFYEIWFVEENNCAIIRYENFDDVFNMSEEDILKDARQLYDSLKMSE